MDRKNIQERILQNMAMALTAEQYRKMEVYFNNLSDIEFFELSKQAKAYADPNMSLKEYAKLTLDAQKANGITSENTAMNDIPMSFLSDADNDELLKKISNSNPSDVIRLTRESDLQLMDLWESNSRDRVSGMGITIPSDIFFAETIPLMDCKIVVDERGYFENGTTVKFRVVIFEDYAERLRQAHENNGVAVGATFLEEVDQCFILPIVVAKGVDSIFCSNEVGHLNMPAHLREHVKKQLSRHKIQAGHGNLLETWYGLQIALLHPTVREVFKSPKTTVNHTSTKRNSKSKKRKVKYIKEHIINKDQLDKLIYGENSGDRAFKRHALVWYVIGHWRTYKSGKKVFVQPYWKGALRELKQAIPEREREIAQVG